MQALLGDILFSLFIVVPALGLIAMRVVSSEKPRQSGPASGLSTRGRRLLRS